MTTRLRTNFVQGSVNDAPLLIAATTINAAEFANLPVVVAPDFLVLELDPLRAVGAPEIVYVTAHDAAATSVTVLRGQEGTTARQHNQGERWVHGASTGDFWGGGQQWYGRQQIDGPVEVLNDLNVIPAGNALQLAGSVTGFEPASVNHSLAYLNNGGAALYDPGEGAIELKATVGTDPLMYYNMPTRTTAFPVVPLRRYWAMGRARPTGASPARTIRCYINFYDNTGTLLPNSSTDTVEVTGGAWVIATHVATAPATAAYATIAFTPVGAATNETHAFTAFGFGSGTTAPAAWITPYVMRLSDVTKRDSEYSNTGLLDVETSGYGDLESRMTRYSSVSWSKGFWMVRRARGTKAAPTNVSPGDYVGGVRAVAWMDGAWRGLGDINYLVDNTFTGQAAGRLLLMANNMTGSASYGLSIYGSTGRVQITASRVQNDAPRTDFMAAGGIYLGFNRSTDTGVQNFGASAWTFSIAGSTFNLYAYDSGGGDRGAPLSLSETSQTITLDLAWSITFAQQTRQMIHLWGYPAVYGIGVQASTHYFRTGSTFAWFRNGVHSDTQYDPGAGGELAAYLDAGSNFYLRKPGTTVPGVGIESTNARLWARGDQNGIVGYDYAGNIRYLFGLRSDVTGNTSDQVWYSYGGAASIMVGGFYVFKGQTNGYPWLRPPAWNYPTYQNSWTDYGTGNGWERGRYCIDAEGFVHIEGLIAAGSTGGGTVIFNLPAGFRPAFDHMFVCQAAPGAALARIDIHTDGNVVFQNWIITGTNGYLQLDAIVFSVN